jgi:hypothetical protein
MTLELDPSRLLLFFFVFSIGVTITRHHHRLLLESVTSDNDDEEDHDVIAGGIIDPSQSSQASSVQSRDTARLDALYSRAPRARKRTIASSFVSPYFTSVRPRGGGCVCHCFFIC